MEKPQIGMKLLTKQFEMGVLDAAVHFDIDNRATLLIYDKMLRNERQLKRKYKAHEECESKRYRKCKNPTRKLRIFFVPIS